MSDIEEVPECLHLKKCPTSGPALRMHMVNAHMNGPRKKCGVCPHNTAGNNVRTEAFEDATEFPIINPYGELLEVEMLAEIRKDPVEQQKKFIAVIAEDKLPNVPARLRYAFANKKTDGADYLAGIPPPSPLLKNNEKANKIMRPIIEKFVHQVVVVL